VDVALRRILFIANGHGEDSIAAELVSRLPSRLPADAFPLVGEGGAFAGICPVVGPRAHVPSQGWRHTRGSVWRDLRGGMLAGIGPAVGFLRSVKHHYDSVVVVGDNVGLLLCRLAGMPVSIYLDVFKSGFAHRYSAPERLLLKSTARTVFCRDAMLAESLQASGIDGRFAGNVMLDTVPYGSYDTSLRRLRPLAMTLLPGSRATTGDNLALQVEALALLPELSRPDIFVAVARDILPQHLAEATGLTFVPPLGDEPADLGTLTGLGLTLHLATGVAGNLMEEADLVLSQAGTATQQALGLGKPVVTFNRSDNRPKRMADEQALMGEARELVPPDPAALARAVEALIADPAERTRRGEIGRQRLGPAGAAEKIVAQVLTRVAR